MFPHWKFRLNILKKRLLASSKKVTIFLRLKSVYILLKDFFDNIEKVVIFFFNSTKFADGCALKVKRSKK